MLYDFQDFARVLHTLSKLSHCSVSASKKPNVLGFPITAKVKSSTGSNSRLGADALPEEPEEEIYRYSNIVNLN